MSFLPQVQDHIGSFPGRLISVILAEFSSYLAFVVDGIKPNGRKIYSNEYCRALSFLSCVQRASLYKSKKKQNFI
jgi:hypothetical protein